MEKLVTIIYDTYPQNLECLRQNVVADKRIICSNIKLNKSNIRPRNINARSIYLRLTNVQRENEKENVEHCSWKLYMLYEISIKALSYHITLIS